MRVLLLTIVLSLAAPLAYAQTGAPAKAQTDETDGLAGIYVQCPRKNDERCAQAKEDFRLVFPNGQPHPFFMIRKSGGGYLAPDDRISIDFIIEEKTSDTLIFRMDDQNKSKMELQKRGDIWRDRKSGDLYMKAIEDEEWNIEPEPFKNKKKKAGKK